MDFNFSQIKNGDLVRTEIDGNAIRMNKTANRRLLSAPRSMVARVKQLSARSIVLSYDAKRPLAPPKEEAMLSEMILTVEDMPYVKKLELAIKPKGNKESSIYSDTVNKTINKTIEMDDAKESIREKAQMLTDRLEVASPKAPGFLAKISTLLKKLFD